VINCKECHDYANSIYARGEITQDEIPKLVMDRHILKGCEQEKAAPVLDIDLMNIEQVKEVVKMLMRLMNHEHDRVSVLQDRVLALETKGTDLCLKNYGAS
jgi:hypothetical protein